MKLHINDKIKDLRKAQKWTQEDLAERLNVSPQAVSRWETNATFPDIELLPDIASIFEVSVDELLGVNDLLNNDRIKKIISEANSYYDTNEVDKVVSYLEQAKIYANKLPDMEYTSNVVLPSILEGDDKVKFVQENIKNLISTLDMQVSYLVNIANYTDEEKITILKKLDSMIELMYEKNDYIYANWILCGNNMNIADIYAKLKDEKNTCLHLSKAVKFSKIGNKKESNSLLNNVLEYDMEKTFGKTFEQDEVNMILSRVKDESYDFVRNTKKFKEIINNLNKNRSDN